MVIQDEISGEKGKHGGLYSLFGSATKCSIFSE